MNRILLCLLAAVAVFVAVACAPTVNLLDETKLHDTSLLSGEPCSAPCWNGIVPGETSYRDAKILIEDDGRFSNVEEMESEEGSPARGFRFSPSESQACCQIVAREGEVVDSMLLQLAPRMTLGPALDQYGEPKYLLGAESSGDQASVALIWPDVPMVVFAFVAGAAEGELSAASEIFMLMYMAEPEMRSLVDANRLYVWEGYQSYAAYMDGDYDFVGESAPLEGEQ